VQAPITLPIIVGDAIEITSVSLPFSNDRPFSRIACQKRHLLAKKIAPIDNLLTRFSPAPSLHLPGRSNCVRERASRYDLASDQCPKACERI
jgi:hypothetical protein